MKAALAPEYRITMFATLGLGTAILWARSLRWPCSIDTDGLTLRYYRKVPWKSIEKINVWRDYYDGHVSRIDIHHRGSVDRIALRASRNGQNIATTVLAMFKQVSRARPTTSARGEANPASVAKKSAMSMMRHDVLDVM
jgi:hypothetical protein